ncbi:hypothetical protein LINGRAHAP2_LOCUS32383 [Linum grandiflorum]
MTRRGRPHTIKGIRA